MPGGVSEVLGELFFSRGVDQGFEEIEVLGRIDQSFRVPLDGDEEWVRRILGRFDDAIGAVGTDDQISADRVDGLLVTGVGLDEGRAHDAGQARIGIDRDGVSA